VATTPAAIKSLAGAWVHLRIARCCKGASAIEDLKQASYWIAALAPEGALTVYDLDTTRRLVRVVGSEGRSVREILKKGAEFVVRILMRGRIGNVSVAAALPLSDIARRRGATAAALPPAPPSARTPVADEPG
jgi:23S rRNA (guanosine2251-2'-O)-methyltransferase